MSCGHDYTNILSHPAENFVARKYSVIRRTPSFEQILIKQAYFLVKNGASYKWINTVIICAVCNLVVLGFNKLNEGVELAL